MKTKIKKEMRGDIAILHFSGDMLGGPDSANKFPEELKIILEEGIKKVVVDLEKVKRMNSSGLGILMRGYTTLKNNDTDLKLVCLNESLQGIMVLTKLNTVFETYRTLEGAVRNF
jgi:anti-sigma B factor antagonist